MKICNVCKIEKSIDKFPKNSKGKLGVGQKCDSCSAEYASKYREQNKAKIERSSKN